VKLRSGLIILGWLVSLVLCALWGIAQRGWIGNTHGTVLGIAEASLALMAYILYRLHAARAELVPIIAAFYCAVVFAFMAWLVHPTQLYDRAWEREWDMESAMIDFLRERQDSMPAQRAAEIRAFFESELAARRYEREAAVIRSGPEVRSRGYDAYYGFLIASGYCLIAGLILWMSRAKKGARGTAP
jgi:hypothetical protein